MKGTHIKADATAQELSLQGLSLWLASWSNLIGEQGLISVEPWVEKTAAFPEAPLSEALQIWHLAICNSPGKLLSPSKVLAAAAVVGLVPRPGAGLTFSRCPLPCPLPRCVPNNQPPLSQTSKNTYPPNSLNSTIRIHAPLLYFIPFLSLTRTHQKPSLFSSSSCQLCS